MLLMESIRNGRCRSWWVSLRSTHLTTLLVGGLARESRVTHWLTTVLLRLELLV